MSFEFGVSLAMIGDEDVTCSIQLEAYPSYRKIKRLDYFFEKFADINSIIRLTDEVLEKKPEFDVIMLFPILWDIVYMDFNEFNTPTIHLKRDYNTFDNLVSLIASSQNRWKVTHPNVTIFWCMPFTPDFYRFNKYTDFWVEQNAGRNFYRVIRKLGSELYTNVPGIHLLDLHECYFFKFSVCENSFYQNIDDEPLRYIHSCTKDGLHTTEEFISNFVSVFENKVYPVILKSNRKYISDPSPSTVYDYSNRRLLPMRVFDYSSKTSGRSGTSDNLNYESDSQNSKQFNTDQDNTVFERSSNELQNFHIQSNNYQSPNLNYERDSQSYPPYQSDDYGSNKNQQTQSSNFDDNYCDSYTPQGFTNDNSNQSYTNQFLPVGSNFSLTDLKNDNVSSKSITEALSSYLKAEDSNASDSSTKFQQQNNPQYNSRTSWEDQSLSHLSHSPSSSFKDPDVKQNIGNDFLKGLSDIPPNIFNNIKNALNFLGSSSNTDKKDDSSSNNTDGKDSPYYEVYIKNFFSPLHWKDIFLSGDESIALECLKTSVNSLNRIPYKKGMVIVMVTTSEKMVSLAQEALKPLVESNTIGLNDEITFGVPLVLVDTTCNIQLRLNQIKQQSLSDLSALLVFGDDLLDLSSLLFIELTHLVKQLLSFSRGDVNKVVISQSGSASIEVSAQSIFNVTFLSPKRKIDKEKEVEKFNQSVGLTDFLKISSCDLEISNDCRSSVQSSSFTPVVERQDESVDTRVQKVSSRDKSSKTYKVESKKSTSRHRSPQKTSRSSHSSASTSTASKSSKSTVKLEDIFKRARISIPEEKKKENEAFNKEFMKKLEKMPRSIQKTYMAEGKEVLIDHESTYKTYKDVPDLHPLYEEKYEFFIKLFEEAYGHTYNPKHLQSTWKRFWVITVSCFKDLEWLDRKKELQEQFMIKHGMKSDVKSKEIESDKVKKERNEDKKIKLEKTRNNKNVDSKSGESVKKTSEAEGNKAKTLKGEDTKENKVAISKSEEIKKETIETERNNVKTMKVDIKENKTMINKSIVSNKKATEREGNDVKTLKEDNEENKKTINKSVESGNKASETEGSKMKTTKEEDIKENINKEAEVKLEKEKEIPKMEDKGKNREDAKSQSKNTNKASEDKEENKLKKRSSSPGPLENISKKAKRIVIKLPKSKSPPIITIDDESHNVTSGENENVSKISECNNKNEVKNSDSSLKAVVEMRRKLIIDAEEEDKYPLVPFDGKANEKKQKKDCKNESKEIVVPEKQNSKTVSCEKKSTPPIMKDKSKVEEKSFSQTLKNTDSLMKKVDKLLTKTSQLSDSKSLSGADKKLSYSDRGLDKSLSDSRKDDDKHLSSTLYRQSKTGNITRKEDKYHVGDKHSKLDTYKRKSNERDDFQSKRKSDSDKSIASIEKHNFHSRSDTDRGKYLPKREDRSSFNRVENSSVRKGESSIFQDRKGDKPSYKNSLLNLLSSKEDIKSKSEHDETDLSSLISPFTKTPTNKFSTELSSSVKPLFPIQISQGNSSGSNLRKNENQPETKEDFMKLYVNTCSELSRKKSQTIEAGTSRSRTSTKSILEELDSLVKPSFHKASDSTKSKIVINLGKPKMQFSLYEALNSLESVCSDIGVMGAALNSIVETSRALLPNFYESYKIFTDSDSELLVNIAINKLKSFSSQSTESKVKYQKTIALAEKLLEEAKKSALKGPPPSANIKPAVKSRINVEAVAKATVGLSVKDTYQFIKNTFVYKGLSEPSKTEIEQVFEEVSKFHFEFALKS